MRNYGIVTLKIFVFTLPLVPVHWSSYLIALMIVFCLRDLRNAVLDKSIILWGRRFSWILGFYFLGVVGLLYSADLDKGLMVLEHRMSLVLIPLIVFLLRVNREEYKSVLKLLLYGTMVSCILCNLYQVYLFGEPFHKYGNFLLSPLDIDATYLGLYICFSLIFMFDFVKDWKELVVKILASAYLFTFLFYIGSKVSVLIVLVLAVIKVVFFSKKKWLSYGVLLLLVLGIYMSTKIPYAQRRFYTPVEKALKGDFSSLSYDRDVIFDCSIEQIKQSWLIGYGTGDYNLITRDCLRSNDFKKDSNAHNQYFSIMLQYGIVGLSIFFIALYQLVKKSGRLDFLTISFLIIFLISFLSESVLHRNKGILLFILMYTFLNSNKYVWNNRV